MKTYLFHGTWRELSKTIKIILYKWIAKEIIKENYITSYNLNNQTIEKKQMKKVHFLEEDETKLKNFLNNNFKEWI